MQKTSAVIFAAGLVIVAPATSFADGGVMAKVGLMGAGIEYVQPLSKFFAIRAVANGGRFDTDATESDINYDLEIKMGTAGAILDWHPFGGVLFASAGLLYNRNQIYANASGNGNVTVGDTTYLNPNVKAEVNFNKAAPYLGVGWGHRPEGKGLSMAFELGVLFQGSPDVTLTSNSVSQDDLDQEAADLEQEFKNFKYYPQVAFSIGYRF